MTSSSPSSSEILGTKKTPTTVYTYTVDGVEVDFILSESLKRGGFSRPEVCFRKIVLKRVPIDDDVDPRVIEREARVMAAILHRNILRIYHTWRDTLKKELVMELEYCAGGSLARVIQSQHQSLFEAEQVRSWLAQLSVATAYLHKNGIVHRDLKPDNVLFTTDRKTIKLADFGAAKFCDTRNTSATWPGVIGTLPYMAPELFGNPGAVKGDPKVDVWALGVITYELATLTVPYKPCFVPQLERKPINITHFPLSLQNMIDKLLLVVEPAERANMDSVLRHNFIAKDVPGLQAMNDEFLKEKQSTKPADPSLVPATLYEQCQKELADANASSQELQKELNVAHRGLKATKSKDDLSAVLKELTDVKKAMQQDVARAEALDAANALLKQQLANAQKDQSELEAKCTSLKEELAKSAKMTNEKLKTDKLLTEVQNRNQQLEAKIITLTNEKTVQRKDELLQHGPLVSLRGVSVPVDVGILWEAVGYRLPGISPSEQNRRAGQLLIMAVRNNCAEAVKYLLYDFEAIVIDASVKNAALRKAAMLGYAEVVELLLASQGCDCSSNVNKAPKSGANCLMLAAASGSKRCFDVIFAKCPKGMLKETDLSGNNVLMAAATNCSDDSVEIAKVLVKKDPSLLAMINQRTESALLIAAICNNVKFVRWLIEGDLATTWQSFKDFRKRTALMAAANSRAHDVARLLIERGADFSNNVRSTDGWTILMCAAISGSVETVRVLIDRSADFSNTLRNSASWTVLICAVYSGSAAVVKLLLDRGADFSNNVRDKSNQTVLMHAARYGSIDVVRLLLARGADRSAKDAEGDTAADHAKMCGHNNIIPLLK